MIIEQSSDIMDADTIQSLIDVLMIDAGTDNVMDIIDNIEMDTSNEQFFRTLTNMQIVTDSFVDAYIELNGELSNSCNIHMETLYEFISSERENLNAGEITEYILSKYMEISGDGVESLYGILTESYMWDECGKGYIELDVKDHVEYREIE